MKVAAVGKGTPEHFEKAFVRARSGRTLIIGSCVYPGREDRRKLYQDVVGVDMVAGMGVDEVMDLEEDSLEKKLGKFEHVECISVLEHTQRPRLVAKNIMEAMNQDATLHLSVPFVWRVHAYPSDYWRLTISAVEFIFRGIHWKNLMYGCAGDYSLKSIPSVNIGGVLYFARAEVYGFGIKK